MWMLGIKQVPSGTQPVFSTSEPPLHPSVLTRCETLPVVLAISSLLTGKEELKEERDCYNPCDRLTAQIRTTVDFLAICVSWNAVVFCLHSVLGISRLLVTPSQSQMGPAYLVLIRVSLNSHTQSTRSVLMVFCASCLHRERCGKEGMDPEPGSTILCPVDFDLENIAPKM